MIYARKTLTGYKEIPSSDASTDTYTIMPIWQYAELKQKVEEFQRDLELATQKNDTLIIKAKKQQAVHNTALDEANDQILRLQKENFSLQDRVTYLIVEKDAAVTAKEQAEALNHNLKRIARERANSDRGLPPKSHTGYIPLRTDQVPERYTIYHDYAEWRKEHPIISRDFFEAETPMEALVWRTHIQTPYVSSLPAYLAEAEILSDLTGGILAGWGCQYWQPTDQNGVFRLWQSMDGTTVCGLFHWRFMCDYRVGYWGVTLYTTLPLHLT